MKIKIKMVVKYNGHNIKENGNLNLNFKAGYSEMVNSIKILQMLNNDVKITAKIPDESPIEIGMFRVNNVSFDDDGESKIRFNSMSDFVELDNLNKLITTDEFVIRLTSEVELEDEEEEE